MKITRDQLLEKQSKSLDWKIQASLNVIAEWEEFYKGEVYVAYSGGLDSTVLLDLVRSLCPEIEGVFCNTGLEYPEIVDFVKATDNVTIVRPEMTFRKVIKEHGYPVVSKIVSRQIRQLQNPGDHNAATRNLYLTGYKRDRTFSRRWKLAEKWKPLIDAPFKVSDKCCDILKKDPLKKFAKKTGKRAFVGMMVDESELRKKNYLETGCNAFDSKEPISTPLAFWTKKDIQEYIQKNKLPYCSVYDQGVKRTGCIFCMFGVHLEKEPNRFQLLRKTHPKQWNYCINKLGIGKVLDFIGVDYESCQTSF